ncbi:10199_t:CDS:2 [Funneliformis geosporum]|nr:10199_t:CDS:2 [Funneliformis geosporum]
MREIEKIQKEIGKTDNDSKKLKLQAKMKEDKRKFAEEINVMLGIKIGLNPEVNAQNFSSEAVIETEINERTNNEEEELIGEQILLENESKIKNFLLIGGTGNGKSTLANVITGTNNFKESKKSVSKTRNIQSEMFEENENKYLIIDTPGLGDTQLALIRVLDIIAEAVYLVKDGISQVLFVIGNRFGQNEMDTYNLLRTIIFDEHVTNYTTIIRPCFENFNKEEECKEDVDLMIRKKGELAEIIESCQRNVIHVNNPPLNIASVDNENEKQKKERMDDIKSNKRARNKSRVKILDNLSKCFQKVPYKPPKLKKLSTEIVDYMENKKELEKKLVDLKSNIIRKKKLINNITESQEFENKSDANKINIIDDFEEKIKQLESKKEILNKEIIVKKEIIRKKVLEHILNDIDKLEETFAEKIKKKEN